ncbi:MAG: bifunctional [glutamine synthetase] adenylyltransferase/[glutamine synthetase]-adenylyl-L-tyrosine phosphorylase [Ornithinimicrobium sp.]|uniref:bifunctional [glutamine synthetase] adenylyltransferase/[glutamine synthetase]-adenylyl-L-tyrosine phosphorylase n=1 Tax=Ornithinimicrobium sp. TaxID=1977084 RepID=UPI0026E0F11D|nr:bifunctional [glutamine synthetase] adenylyltransferase/[glutamine synthetase]-adenylyl-L-tyrosine phosphorylase [Ornithinimicrobium sp.]MDO5739532.1 bifunctional [glutamine synthetase] adenylyltransferase/[glutamine synthetase]-adenylyl-L-tyrosine phosphorylase [Ornithinimicrobium sp.]
MTVTSGPTPEDPASSGGSGGRFRGGRRVEDEGWLPSSGDLVRAGLADTHRGRQLLEEMLDRLGAKQLDVQALLADLAGVADPDAALLVLVRLLDPRSTGVSGRRTDELTAPVVLGGGDPRRRLFGLLGGSVALAEHLLRHPEHVEDVASGGAPQPFAIVEAVRGLVGPEGADALRVAYRRQLLRVATHDLTSRDPIGLVVTVGAWLADLASAALQAAVLLARAETEGESGADFTVIGMGKTGGRELNYLSDVDVIFLAAPREGTEEEEALHVGTKLASAVMRVCGQSTREGTLWQVDAALRPEGKHGPLVRSLHSHQEYYQRWAKTWEFQALLKAVVVAGDDDLGQQWLDLVRPMVWEASGRDNFVEDVQAMRRRVEQHVRPAEVDRQLKLGPGGIRDIEFSVQLLQLVHGRADDSLRSRNTLDALTALTDGGYVGRDDLEVLDAAYRLLRCLEHRVQVHRLRRTHLMPTSETDLRRLGRAMGERGDAARALLQRWRAVRRDVRRLHERLFYRPLLAAVARLSPDEARLSPAAAREQLKALGFADPAGAMRHLESLTDGLSRRATIQRHLLPVMLSWFADGADPDAGLLAFRRLSDALGTTHWYLGMLRDEGSAAQRLATVLSSSRYAVDLLIRSPGTVSLLGETSGPVAPDRAGLLARMLAAASRQSGPEEAFTAIRSVRARELVRIVLGDVVGDWDGATVRAALSDVTDTYLEAALEFAWSQVTRSASESRLAAVLLVGMGRLGGREMGYVSDADVLFAYDPLPGADADAAAAQATDVITRLRSGLGGAGPDPVLELDADLRPEGKSGPLVRSLESYRAYYQRWSAGWESQALLRARPVAGDPGLAAAFTAMIQPLRWPEGGITQEAVRDIRRLKARMEAERLPRGADPRTHFKLGSGGLSDVEWVVQLLQLQHADAHPALRTTSTTTALAGAVEAGLMDEQDAEVLSAAWELASRMRDAGVAWRGRPVDSVPSDPRDAEGMARVIGRPPGSGAELANDWRRSARHARSVVERLLYGDRPPRAVHHPEPTIAPTRALPRAGRAAGFGTPPASPPPSPDRFPPPRRFKDARRGRGPSAGGHPSAGS